MGGSFDTQLAATFSPLFFRPVVLLGHLLGRSTHHGSSTTITSHGIFECRHWSTGNERIRSTLRDRGREPDCWDHYQTGGRSIDRSWESWPRCHVAGDEEYER